MLMSAAAWERCWCCSPRVDELFCCVSVCDVYITRLSITIVRPSSPHALPVQLSHAACAAHSTPPIVILMWGAVHALRSTLINLRQRSHFFRLGFVVCLRQPKAAGSFVKFLEGVGLGTVTIRFFFGGGGECDLYLRNPLTFKTAFPLATALNVWCGGGIHSLSVFYYIVEMCDNHQFSTLVIRCDTVLSEWLSHRQPYCIFSAFCTAWNQLITNICVPYHEGFCSPTQDFNLHCFVSECTMRNYSEFQQKLVLTLICC